MNLSEFIQLMYDYIGNETRKDKFTVYIFSVLEGSPKEGDDPNEVDDNGKFNPVYPMDESAQRKIFNGTRKIGRDVAAKVVRHYNPTDFLDAVYAIDDEGPKEQLVETLDNYGFKTSTNKVDEYCADIFLRLMKNISEGQNEVLSDQIKPRDSKGKPISEVALPTAYIADGKLHVGGDTIDLPEHMKVSDQIGDEEQPYIKALCDAFSDALKTKVTPENINTLPKHYQREFNDQRNYYNSAMWVQHSVRDIYPDGGDDQFQILKEDAYEGIKETYFGTYENGYERLTHVLIKITSTTLDKSVLSHIKNLIGNLEKKGLCHILVNDGTIVSWVDPDAE